jgi:hypothetical protein
MTNSRMGTLGSAAQGRAGSGPAVSPGEGGLKSGSRNDKNAYNRAWRPTRSDRCTAAPKQNAECLLCILITRDSHAVNSRRSFSSQSQAPRTPRR